MVKKASKSSKIVTFHLMHPCGAERDAMLATNEKFEEALKVSDVAAMHLENEFTTIVKGRGHAQTNARALEKEGFTLTKHPHLPRHFQAEYNW